MVFSVKTKNWNWEVSTKNFVTFKRWDSVNGEKFKYYGSSLKDPILRGVKGGGGGGAWKNNFSTYLKKNNK